MAKNCNLSLKGGEQAGGANKDVCPHAPERSMDAAHSRAGGANKDVCPHAPERSMDAARSRAGGASPSPTIFCNCVNLVRGALLIFASFWYKRKWGCGGKAPATPCEARQLRTECGKRKKALKGCGGKQEFSPTAISPLKINFPQKQSSGLFLNHNLRML